MSDPTAEGAVYIHSDIYFDSALRVLWELRVVTPEGVTADTGVAPDTRTAYRAIHRRACEILGLDPETTAQRRIIRVVPERRPDVP